MKTEDIALLVLHTADTREASFNIELWKCQLEEHSRTATPYFGHIIFYDDAANYYSMTLEQAAEHSCKYLGMDKRLSRFIKLSLEWWNDTIWWANEILGRQQYY